MSKFLLFGDLETGGLNGRLENGQLGMEYYPIFEMAFIVTNEQLEQVGEPLRLVIHQNEENINKSHQWALDTHEKSGLLKEVRLSSLTLEQAEKRVIAWLMSLGIEKYNRKDKTGAMFAGNSIMFDRSYLLCQMPGLHEYMHYRQLDVSALALVTRLWKPELEDQVIKDYKHEALADIRETIAELKAYRSFFTACDMAKQADLTINGLKVQLAMTRDDADRMIEQRNEIDVLVSDLISDRGEDELIEVTCNKVLHLIRHT